MLEALNSTTVEESEFVKGLPFLKFESSGSLEGSTGCNSFMGTYSLAESAKIVPGAMTKMYCQGNAEQEFLDAISKVTDIRLSNSNLVLTDGSSELLKFKAEALEK